MPGGHIRRLKPCTSFLRISAPHQCRHNSTFEVLKGDQLGPVQKDDHQTFRVRKDGEPLPLPPLLDPVVLEERSRWHQPKARPDVKKFTPFQKKLWESPYAHTLASNVRQCRFTGCLMPNELLLSLTPRLHPSTSEPWLLPVSVTTSAKQLGASLKVLCRKPIIEQLGVKKQWMGHLGRRIGESIGGQRTAKMVWREDMPDLVLSMMRKALLNKLSWHIKHSGQMVPVASPRSEDIKDVDGVSCILYFGSLITSADEIQAQARNIALLTEYYANGVAENTKSLDPHKSKHVTHAAPQWWNGPLVPRLQPRAMFPPLEFKTADWRGERVAVYSLCDLLGADKAEELVKESKFRDERCLVVKRARHNVEVEKMLMQMQTYLAVPTP